MKNLANGKYQVEIDVLKQDVDEASMMGSYLSKVALITKTDEEMTLSLLFQSQDTVKGFQIETSEGTFSEAIDQHIIEEKDYRFELFMINSLPEVLNARVQYEAMHEGKVFKGDEPLRITFDLDSMQAAQ